jgi:hypothetical protein
LEKRGHGDEVSRKKREEERGWRGVRKMEGQRSGEKGGEGEGGGRKKENRVLTSISAKT